MSCLGSTGEVARLDEELIEVAAALELTANNRQWGGSVPGHRIYTRDRYGADKRLMANYFVDQPLYNDDHFRRRFRMRQELFLKIVRKIEAANPYFVQKPNCVGQLGFTLIHKCTIAMKMLAYGGAADSLDDHLKMGESTILKH
jgi:hypothetical protein